MTEAVRVNLDFKLCSHQTGDDQRGGGGRSREVGEAVERGSTLKPSI